jgi:arylsulfatase A-like enzyme
MVAASHAQNPGPPNVLVLMAEDLSSRIGAFDDPLARTPNIDRLALEGVRFPNTFTTAGVCAPSRAAFITGMHAISIGAMHMRTSTSPVAPYLTVPPPRIKAFPELPGYHTFTDRKLDYQFSGILAGSGPSTIWDAEGQGDHLAQVPPDRPFFGLINFLITHESAAFLEASVGTDRGRQTARAAARARANLDRRTPPDRISVPPYYPDLPEVRTHIADHYDNIQLMDAQVGEIIAALAARGQLERTILIWTTDHGDPLPRAKRELYDSGIRVPLIVRWPEAYRPDHLAPGAVDERLISFVDLAPTILRLAGISPPTHLHGRDILDPDVPARRYVYAARDRIDEQSRPPLRICRPGPDRRATRPGAGRAGPPLQVPAFLPAWHTGCRAPELSGPGANHAGPVGAAVPGHAERSPGGLVSTPARRGAVRPQPGSPRAAQSGAEPGPCPGADPDALGLCCLAPAGG